MQHNWVYLDSQVSKIWTITEKTSFKSWKFPNAFDIINYYPMRAKTKNTIKYQVQYLDLDIYLDAG